MLSAALRAIVSLDGRAPHPRLPRRLDPLFRDLARNPPPRPANELEQLIWALWIGHEDRELAERMHKATKLIGTRRADEAVAALDALIAADPDWAEAWNKRATLHLLQQRDLESVRDIQRTLALEPRHFGAVCGFAQIALRRGQHAAALAAFETALRIDPHLEGIPEACAALGRRLKSRLN